MQLEQHMALESGIPIPVAQHNSHDDSFPRSDNHNIEDDKEIEDEPSPICSQVPINVTIDQLVPPIAAEGATGPDIAGIAGSHHNADALKLQCDYTNTRCCFGHRRSRTISDGSN